MSEQDLTDRIIRDALALQRLAAHEGAQVDELLAQLEAELRALAASGTLSGESKRAIDALIRQADEAIAARYGEAAGTLDTQRLVRIVAENTQAALDAVNMGNAARISEETAASLARSVLIEGAPTAAWWARQSEDAQFRFAQAIRQGVVNGETNERIVARIAGKDGFMAVSRRNARTLVHSSIMSAANRARLAVYKKNFPHGGGVRWLSTLDSHTCLRCAALDGQAWDFDGKPIRGSEIAFQGIPPLHVSCRCVISVLPPSLDQAIGVAGLDELRDQLSRRASSDGPIKTTTFADFLKRQSPAFVEDVLGVKRAEMFLAGKLTLHDMINHLNTQPLTLDELAN